LKRTIRRALVVATLGLATAGIAASEADASYYLSKRQAQADARDAAETRYAGNGVIADAAACRPQFERIRPGYDYHRWVCAWVGTDGDGAEVYGHLRITGHSNDTYGYMPLYGGLRWE